MRARPAGTRLIAATAAGPGGSAGNERPGEHAPQLGPGQGGGVVLGPVDVLGRRGASRSDRSHLGTIAASPMACRGLRKVIAVSIAVKPMP